MPNRTEEAQRIEPSCFRSAQRNRRYWLEVMGAVLWFVLVPPLTAQQNMSATDGMTPTAMQPGSPAGSYVLSGFDTVNLANRHVNFNLPVLKLAGRGDTALSLNVPIQSLNQVGWSFTAVPYLVPGSCGNNMACQYQYYYSLSAFSWNPYVPGFGSATMVGRSGGTGCTCGSDSTQKSCQWGTTLTRLTLTEPNGTEHELWDQSSGGKPNLTRAGFARGSTFVTHDGTDMVFTSDSALSDPAPIVQIPLNAPNTCAESIGAGESGNLLLRDGTKYRFDGGRVTKITDRNGNVVTYVNSPSNYSYYPPLSITDSFGRTTTIAQSLGVNYTINYNGSSGSQETISVASDTVANLLAIPSASNPNSNSNGPIPSSAAALFPGISYPPPSQGVPMYPPVISTVTLPNQQSYHFFYNKYAYIAAVVLPTGGAYEYDYVFSSYGGTSMTSPAIGAITDQLVERREFVYASVVNGHYQPGTLVAKTTYGWGGYDANNNWIVVVRHYDGAGNLMGSENHNIVPSGGGDAASYAAWNEGKEVEVQHYDNNGATLLGTVDTTWGQRPCTVNCWFTVYPYASSSPPAYDPRINSEQKTLNDSQSSPATVTQVAYGYDQYNNRTDTREYAYANGAPGAQVREEQASYIAAPSYLNLHILDLPFQVTTYDGSSNQQSQATYTYDSAPACSDGNVVCDCPGIIQHDPSYGPSFQVGRGNPTTVTKWLYNPVAQTTTSLTASNLYDIAGNFRQVTDPRGVVFKYTYNDSGTGPGNTWALPTKVMSYPALGGSSPEFDAYATYDYYLTKPLTATDINGKVTSFVYSDSLGRLTSVTQRDGSRLSFGYTDNPNAVAVTTSVDLTTNGDGLLKSTTRYDSLGRTTRTDTPSGTTTTCYDGRGRVSAVSNPQPLGSPLSCPPSAGSPFTTTAYDGMSRARFVTTPDGSVTETRYAGPLTLTIDPAGKTRQITTDAQGRLAQVLENLTSWNGTAVGVVSEATWTTNYLYDPLDDLTLVCQGGTITSGVCSAGLARQFAYDSFKRLLQATNPEGGTIQYGYDASGNLVSRTQGPPSGRVVTSMFYDGLNRVTGKSYSGGSVPTAGVTYCYDNLPNGSGTCQATVATGYLGRPTYTGNGNSSTTLNLFDNMGRVTASTQKTGAASFGFGNYSYYPNGTLQSVTYPSGRQVNYGLDSTGRVSSVKGVLGTASTTYAASVGYTPFNAIQQMTLGTSQSPVVTESRTYNTRMQPTSVTAATARSGSLILGTAYCANPNGTGDCTGNAGNVIQAKITPPGTSSAFVQSFTFDSLNRLKTAVETGDWQQTYVYDQFGNRALLAGTQYYIPGGSWSPQVTADSSAQVAALFPQNRWGGSSVQYDGGAASGPGNMTALPGYTFVYDAENRMVTANQAGNASTGYVYDGDARRVQKVSCPAGTSVCTASVNGATVTDTYVYGATGELIAEYAAQPPTTPCTTCYLTGDTLGSTRIMTDGTGTLKSLHDYLPFGEEVPSGVGARSISYYPPSSFAINDATAEKFTGKERDSETGLDYFGARYLSSAQGRFTSPDPVQIKVNRLLNPQRLNLFSYAVNNPLLNVDPDGRDAIAVVFPDYKIQTPVGRIGGLGHAGVVTIDSGGHTKYFEYGRYDDAGKGLVRERAVPSVVMGPDGKPTAASLNGLMKSISHQAGHDGKIEGAYFKADDKHTAQMNQYAEGREAQNNNPKRESYDLQDNSCGTFMDKTIEAGGIKLPSDLSARPNGQVDPLQNAAGNNVEYDPAKNQTTVTPIKKKEDQH